MLKLEANVLSSWLFVFFCSSGQKGDPGIPGSSGLPGDPGEVGSPGG